MNHDVLSIIKESDMIAVNDLGYVSLEDRYLLKYASGLVDKAHEELPEGQIPFKFVTMTLDRDSEVLKPQGAQLQKFKKNNVFLWAHNHRQSLPSIGKVIKMKKDSESFRGIVEFDIGNDPFADMIYSKYKNGFLNATSVGFIPLAVDTEPVVDGQQGFTYTKYEILEVSAVPVPSNPDALVMDDWKELSTMCSDNGCDIMEKWVAGQMPEWGHKFYMGSLEGAVEKSITDEESTLGKENTEGFKVLTGSCEHKEFDEINMDEDGLWTHCTECKKWVLSKNEITTELFPDDPSKTIESTVNQLEETAKSINKLLKSLEPSEETAGQEIGKRILDPLEIAREVARTIKEDLTKE